MNATSTFAQAQELVQLIPRTIGQYLLGLFLSSILYGVTLLQTYQYFSRCYKRDSIYLCALVVILTFLDTITVVLNMICVWYYLIKNFNNPFAILHINWSVPSSVFGSATVAFLVQSVYAHRAYILGGRTLWIPAIIFLCGLAAFVSGIIYGALLLKNNDLQLVFGPKLTLLSTLFLACSFVADVIITTSITWYLLKGRKNVFKKSDTLIRRLVIYTLNSGIITTACTILSLILSKAARGGFYDIIPYFMLSKCYVNSVLAFLNGRESFRNDTDNVLSFHLDATSTSAAPKSQTMSNPKPAAKTSLSRSSLFIPNSKKETATTSPDVDFSDHEVISQSSSLQLNLEKTNCF